MGASSIPVRDDGVATRPAEHLPQAANLIMRNALASLGQMVLATVVATLVAVISLIAGLARAVACLSVVQSAARADHRRPGRLPGRAGRRGLGVAAWPVPGLGSADRAGVRIRVHRRNAGHAAGRHQAVSVRHLRRPAVSHRIPDPAHRQPRPARHDLPGSAPVLPAGLVLDRRARRGADRDARLGDLQAVGDHLD